VNDHKISKAIMDAYTFLGEYCEEIYGEQLESLIEKVKVEKALKVA
jgi:hypothetical protein